MTIHAERSKEHVRRRLANSNVLSVLLWPSACPPRILSETGWGGGRWQVVGSSYTCPSHAASYWECPFDSGSSFDDPFSAR